MLELLNTPGQHNYCREMSKYVPTGCIFEVELSPCDSSHLYLRSLNGQTLKGRGIQDLGGGEYRVTNLAYKKICATFPVRYNEYLD